MVEGPHSDEDETCSEGAGRETLGETLSKAETEQENTERHPYSGHKKRSTAENLRLQFWRKLRRMDINEGLTLLVACGALATAVVSCTNSVDNKQMASAINRLSDIASAQQDEVNGIANETVALDNEVSATTNEAEQTAALVRPAEENANAARQGVVLSERNFVADQRPYVWTSDLPYELLAGPRLVAPTAPVSRISWNYNLRNFGKSPAYDVRVTQYFENGGPFKFIGATRGGMVIAPGNDATWGTVLDPEPITQGAFAEAMGKDLAIGIRLLVTYKDAAGRSYVSEICWRHLHSGAAARCQDHTRMK